MPICDICFDALNVPIKLQCDHHFCFLCLEYKLLETGQHVSCPKCNLNNGDINSLSNDHNFDATSTNFIWLYSSNYNNLWWSYDSESAVKLECIYKDYLVRQDILKNGNINNQNIKINLPKSAHNGKAIKNSSTTATVYNNIAVNDEDEDVDVDFTDSDIDQSQHTVETPQVQELSYIIKFGTYDYKIDFDLMKQINTTDVWRKRSIKRIEVPTVVHKTNVDSIIQFLKSEHVIGIGGKKF